MDRHRIGPLLLALGLLVTGCGDSGGGTQSITLEFEGVVVTAEVPERVTTTEARLVTFSAENRSTEELTLWIDVAVDDVDPECALGNVEDWLDVETRANDPLSEDSRFPVYRLGPGERSGAALDSSISRECSGGSLDVVIVAGSIDPGGGSVTGRVSVELG